MEMTGVDGAICSFDLKQQHKPTSSKTSVVIQTLARNLNLNSAAIESRLLIPTGHPANNEHARSAVRIQT